MVAHAAIMERETSPKDSLDTGVMELDDSLIGTEDGDEDGETPINSTSTMDELMSALDVLEGHADENIMASRNTEIYWIQTLNQRDQLILANSRSIEDLTRLNNKLKEENELLKEQLASIDTSDMVTALQGEAGDSRKISLQVGQDHYHTIGHVNDIPTTQFFTGISRNTQSKSYTLPLTECFYEFRNYALWYTH